MHAQLLRRFNLAAQQLPLLELNISNRAAPFRVSPRTDASGVAEDLKSSEKLTAAAGAALVQDGLSTTETQLSLGSQRSASSTRKLNADGIGKQVLRALASQQAHSAL